MTAKILIELLGEAAMRFRLLSLGGLVSGGMAWLAYFKLPQALAGRLSQVAFMVFVALLGASLQFSIQGLIRPLTRLVGYYVKLLELKLVFKYWLSDNAAHRQFVYAVSRERFLESHENQSALTLEPARESEPAQLPDR